MKIIFLAYILFFSVFDLTAQKKPLDFAAIDNWPHIQDEKISDNGKFILYDVSSKKTSRTLVVQATDGTWNIKIKDVLQAVFTSDCRHVIFKTFADSLGIVELEQGNIHLIDRVVSFAELHAENGQWVAYQLRDSARDLVLLDLFAGTKKVYPRTKDFTISDDGTCMLLHQTVLRDNAETDSVTCLDVKSGDTHFIWCGKGAFNWVIENNGDQIAFMQERTLDNERGGSEIWYYNTKMVSPALLVNDSTIGMQGITLSKGAIFFSPDGGNLFFHIHASSQGSNKNSLKKPAQCIVWSYQDEVLDPSSESHIEQRQAVVNLHSPRVKVVRIETKKGENTYFWANGHYSNNKVILLANFVGDMWEHNWRPSARPDLYLLSTLNGTRTLLKTDCLADPSEEIGFSPEGNYVYWFDRSKGHWFTYNLKRGIVKNITTKVSFSLFRSEEESPGVQPAFGAGAWLENDTGILIYDKYDIWEVDPDGMKSPINITKGYGRSHHEILRLLNINGDQFSTFCLRDSLVLYTFNTVSKQNGFAKIALNGHDSLVTLYKDSKRIYGVMRHGLDADPSGSFGLKAKNANASIFKPTCDTMYPNLTYTKDFIHFHQLTNFAPQKQDNWYTSELIHWKQPDGITNDGILYKPEDFDTRKKYPLIVFVYEKFSDALNAFLVPALCRGDMEILWYISHNYLVLVPDIHYVTGHPGESAYNSVISGVRYISRMPWVNPNRLGLQGHSFGAYETNYIITKTNLFAAVCSANGVSDLISQSGQFVGYTGYQGFYEMGQGRMGTTLWRRPDLYLNQSPVLSADKVTTPILILHSPLDENVYFPQGVEWFTGLRRLGKKAWMLQYPNEGHNLENEEDQLDYTTRLQQFFDHYLKGAPPPKWMTEGGTSLELDTSGKQP